MFQTNIIFFSSKSWLFFEGIIEYKNNAEINFKICNLLVEGFMFNLKGSHFKDLDKITEML